MNFRQRSNSSTRESGIELLGIFAMCSVVLLHYNGYIGNALELVASGTTNQVLLLLLENFCIVAVDVFVLITGYFQCSTQRRPAIKVVELLIQTSVFRIIIYLLKAGKGGEVAFSEIIYSLIPANYLVILYIAL